jgi:hypothetical protein
VVEIVNNFADTFYVVYQRLYPEYTARSNKPKELSKGYCKIY